MELTIEPVTTNFKVTFNCCGSVGQITSENETNARRFAGMGHVCRNA